MVRDGEIRRIPFALLVAGDILEMRVGDAAPAKIVLCGRPEGVVPVVNINGASSGGNGGGSGSGSGEVGNGSGGSDVEDADFVLEVGEIFRDVPAKFAALKSKSLRFPNYCFHFKLLETPLILQLTTALNTVRPQTVLEAQTMVVKNFVFGKLVWIVLVITVVVNVFRIAFLSKY